MKRVGFIVLTSNNWLGGINYFKNLLSAISKLKDRKIQPVLFFGTKENKDTIKYFSSYGEIIQSRILDKDNFLSILNSVSMRLFNRSFLLEKLFIDNTVDIVSHSRFITNNKKIKTINWIVDFQHIHLPEMFSVVERLYRNILFSRYAKYSDLIVLSSNSTFEDFKKIFPAYTKKAVVLHFVSQIYDKITKCKNLDQIKKMYDFSGNYFFLPNQLWKHKNHMVVLRAVNLLKNQGRGVLVICTGNMNDYRNSKYVEEIKRYVELHNLEKNIRFLGVVENNEFLTLFKYSLSVINPSLFEGWSTTVEEAKSIGKNLILSDINVHREQNPPNSVYFNPNNEKELAEILWRNWKGSTSDSNFKLGKLIYKNLLIKTEEFGENFQNIVFNTLVK